MTAVRFNLPFAYLICHSVYLINNYYNRFTFIINYLLSTDHKSVCYKHNYLGMASSSRGIQIGSAWFQRKINLRPQHRGVHLVTEEILKQIPEISQFSVGLCHIQSKHF